MLIPSARHKPEDLRLWEEFAAADKLAGDALARSGKIEEAMEAVRRFLERGPTFISLSLGKDSITIADLSLRVQPRLPVVYIREIGLSNPHQSDVARDFCAKWPTACYLELPVFHDEILRLQDGNRPMISTETPAFRAGCLRAENQFGGRIMGIRREESSSRKISAAVHGVATDKVCRPILYWKNAEVFAYLALRDLPIHPNYAMLGGGRWSREYLRVDCLSGPQGRGMGRHEWEREYYPDILREIENQKPHRQAVV